MSGLKVVILGSGGLVGNRLCSKLANFSKLSIGGGPEVELKRLCFFDQNEHPIEQRSKFKKDSRVVFRQGDITCKQTMTDVLNPEDCSKVACIHLAALLSGYAEDNFDLGMKVNLWGTLNVMERMRNLTKTLREPQVYVYTSTDYVACFNEHNQINPVNEESFRLSPVSYGIQKAANELFVCDYSRKGFLDGRVARISAVIGRPGWSNSISYPYTGIFTQPLEGKNYDVPLPFDIPYPCSSLNNTVDCFIYLTSKVFSNDLGHNRVIQLPAKSWTLNEIWATTQEVAKDLKISLGDVRNVQANQGDTSVKKINVCNYVDFTRATSLGLPDNVNLKEIIGDYCKNFVLK